MSELCGLFDPLTLRDVTIRNRTGMPPMCMWSAGTDGFVTDWHVTHYATRGEGGVGLVIVEATAVDAEGRISTADLGVWSDDHVEGLSRIASRVSRSGAVAALQIGHAGRKGSLVPPLTGSGTLTPENGGWIPLAPSAVPFSGNAPTPSEMLTDDIDRIKEQFTAAAGRANLAGFDALEIHSAHGYLLSSFLSPLANKREDEYGGNREGRSKMLLETVQAVRAVWPDGKPLLVRISCTDWRDDGWTPDDSVWLAGRLAALGVDMLDCSSGGNTTKRPTSFPGFQVRFSAQIKTETTMPTAAVGMITEPTQAEMIIRSGQADMVLLGRELLREPYWPMKACKELRIGEYPAPKPYAFLYR